MLPLSVLGTIKVKFEVLLQCAYLDGDHSKSLGGVWEGEVTEIYQRLDNKLTDHSTTLLNWVHWD